MKKGLKRAFKIAGLTVCLAVALILIVLSVLTYIVFTPSKITPLVVDAANSYLDARTDIDRVELTFFSTFPNLSLKIDKGTVVPARMPSDTLLDFRKCRIVINPVAYLRKGDIIIKNIRIDSAAVRAFINEEGQDNWSILKDSQSDTLEAVVPADTLSAGNSGMDGRHRGVFLLKRMRIRNASISYDDRSTGLSAEMDKVNLRLGVGMAERGALLGLNIKCGNVKYVQDGKTVVDSISPSFNTKLKLSRSERSVSIEDTEMHLNEIRIAVDGKLVRDTLDGGLDVNIGYSVISPSVEKMLRMIPETVMEKTGIAAAGNISVSGKIYGKYGNGEMPVVEMNAGVGDASFHYDGLPYGIDYLEADIDAKVDMSKRTDSYVDLKIFKMRGLNTDIFAKARISELYEDPLVELETKSVIDLVAMSGTFPLQDGIEIGGHLDADIKFRSRLSTIRNQDFGRIFAAGKMKTDSLFIRDTLHGFNVSSNAELKFFGGKMLGASATVSSFDLNGRSLMASVDSLTFRILSERPKDTTGIFMVKGDFGMKELKAVNFSEGDTLMLYCKRGSLSAGISPQKANRKNPRLEMELVTDSIAGKVNGAMAGIMKGTISLQADKLRDSVWIPSGKVNFNRMEARFSGFRLPVKFNKAAVGFGNGKIELSKARIRVGRSNLVLSGYLAGLYRGIRHGGTIKGQLDVSSKNINMNQLLRAISVNAGISDSVSVAAADSTVAGTLVAINDSLLSVPDTISSAEDTLSAPEIRLFAVPGNVDFELNLKVDKMRYSNVVCSEIVGKAELKDSNIYLENLQFKALGSEFRTSMIYRAVTDRFAYAGFDLKVKDADLQRMVNSVPSIDTLVPMLKSFKGRVNVDVAAETVLDSLLNVKIPTLRSALYIRGDSLVLMDGETFAEISKMLMFKNKKENVFDSISVNMTVENGNVNIYPFIVEIDRYKAAAGGTQSLDMSFDYHISILKSPLPFKAGVNITGTLDNIKFGIGKAKYKDAVTPAEIRKIDTLRLNLSDEISSHFKSASERKRWKGRASGMVSSSSRPARPVRNRTDSVRQTDTLSGTYQGKAGTGKP